MASTRSSGSSGNCMPAFRQAIRNAGLTPMCVGRVSAATSHWRSGSPSISTTELSKSSAETSAFHIIHAVVVKTSAARRA